MSTSRGDRSKAALRRRVPRPSRHSAWLLLALIVAALAIGGTSPWSDVDRTSAAAATGHSAKARVRAPKLAVTPADRRVTQRRMRRARAAAVRRRTRLASPASRELRARSRTVYRGLQARGALSTARRAHRAVAVQPLWRGPVLKKGERIVRYASPNAAVIAAEGSTKLAMVESVGTPFAVGPESGTAAKPDDLRPVDLELQATDHGWRPTRAAADITLPRDVGDRIEVGSSLSVGLDGASDVTPATGARTAKTKVFYAGLATDTDAFVEPVADGVSVAWMLRSPTAPDRLRFDLGTAKPDGDKVNDDGSLTLTADGRRVGSVSAPVAFDAQRTAVPARFVVENGQVTVAVDHRGRDLAYPIAVDPVVRQPGVPDAIAEQDDSHGTPPRPMNLGWSNSTQQPGAFNFFNNGTTLGITALGSDPAGGSGSGSAWWAFDPIRTSAPYQVLFATVQLYHYKPDGACIKAGIYDPNLSWPGSQWYSYWNGSYTPGGPTPWHYTPVDRTSGGYGPFEDCSGNRPTAFVQVCRNAGCVSGGAANSFVVFQLNTGGTIWANAVFSGAYIYHRESDRPTATATASWNQGEWSAFKTGGTVTVAAHDDGVGLCGDASNGFPPVVTLRDTLSGADLATAGNSGCTGMTYDRPAPSDQTYSVAVPGDKFAEGIRLITTSVTDVVGNKSAVTQVGARVDRSAPELALSGALYVDRDTPFPVGAQPALTAAATDGSSGPVEKWRSGVQQIQVLVDGVVVKTADQPTAGDNKALSTSWTPAAGALKGGTHEVEVKAKDRLGHVATQQFTVTVTGGGAPRAAEPGLGFEDWQTYDSTDTGAGSIHRVNLATGNSLWSVAPVSNPGIGFDTSLRLTYNSLEPSALRPDLAAYKPFAYGVAGRGVSVQLGSITRLNEPLWIENGDGGPSVSGSSSGVQRVVLTDGDGTRHVFKRNAATGVRFDAPPGVHLALRRFKDDLASPQYWAATRPDGSTFFFYRDGRASEAKDRHDNTTRLTWEQRPDYASAPTKPGCGYAAACRYRVTEVLDAAATNAVDLTGSNNTADDRKWVLHYDTTDPMRLVSVEDRKRVSGPSGPVRRRTALTYDADGRLTGVTAAANAPDGAARRTWGLEYVAGSAFLNRVIDPRSSDTRIRYTAAQGSATPLAGLLDPLLGFAASAPETRQVAAVADRESTSSDSAESRERIYRYDAPVAAGQGFAMATWVRDARKVSSRYSMDHLGRLTRLIEDLDDPARTDDAPASGAAYIQRGTAQTWDGAVNAVASITRGLKGADAPFDTAEATSTEYTWGPLGQLLAETEHKGVAGASPGGADQRSRSWVYRTHNGTVEGEGDGGGEFVYDITKETDRRGKPTTYVYGNDDTGDPQQVKEPGEGEQDFRYNSRGLVIEHSVRQWKGSDNADDSQKKSWAKAADNVPGDFSEKTFATDTFGEFDGNGDARLRVDARGKNWRTVYDDVGNAIQVGDARAGMLLGVPGSEAVLANTDDPASALTGTLRDAARSGSGGGQPYVARYTFDTLDRQVAVATPKRSAATQSGSDAPAADRFVVTATTYDRNDNVTAERDAESQSTLRTFTKTDQISVEQQPAAPQHAEPGPGDPEAWGNGAERAPVTKFAYDENDNLTVRKDPVPNGDEPIGAVGYRKRWTFDRLGRSVLQVEEGTSAAAAELKLTSRAYDLRDNVVAEIDPRTNGVTAEPTTITNAAAGQGLRYRYEYDPFDRLVRQTENPRQGAQRTETDVNRESRWDYDAEDHQVFTRTPQGRDTQRTFDDRGDLVKLEEAFTYILDADSGIGDTDSFATTTINRRLDGRPTEVVSPRGHDNNGDPIDGSTFRTRFKYFDTGELRSRWLPRAQDQYGPSEWQVRYDINDVGDPVAVRDARGKLLENTFVDTGELATTTRPSWWIYDQSASSIRERTDVDPAPADASTGAGGLPSEPGNGDFGKVQPQPLPDVMPAAGETAVSYNDRMQPTTVKGQGDDAGKTISQTLDYDRLGRLTRRELPKDPGADAGTSIELAWQYNVRGLPRAARRLRSSADGNSAVTFWDYDGFDRETKTTAPPSCQGSGCLAPVTTTAYDRNDVVTGEDLPAQARTIQGRVGTTTGTRRYTIDRADRRVATDDESGAHTETVYDFDDLVSKRYAPRAFVADDGQTRSQPNAEFATEYRYDGAGRVTREVSRVTDADGGRNLITSRRYDREGNLTSVSAPGARNSEDGPAEIAQRVTSRVYDARGLLWKSTIGEGENKTTTITEYDGAGNLRRTVNPKGVKDPGDGATPRYADEGDIGTTGRSAWHATLQTYDADQGLIGRTMPWGDGDGGAADEGRHRYRQEFERSKRGLVSGITEIFDATGGDAPRTARADTQIERNLAGWPIKSTDRRLDGSTWKTVGAPLKYDYDQLGNQKLWSSIGDQRTIQRSFYRSGQLRVKCGRRTAGGSQEQVYSYRYNNGGALTEVVDWVHRSATPAGESCQPEGDDASTSDIRKTAIARDRAERPTVVNETWATGKDTAIRYFGSVPNLVSSVQTDGRVSGTNGSTYDGGKSTAYSYDQQDRNTQVRVRDDGDLSGTPDRTTDMAWWPSGERRSTKKPKTASDARTVDSRFYNSRGEVVRRRADPASGITKTYVYTYDENGNRTKDERGTSLYNARDQLTKWDRIRRKSDGTAMPASGEDGYLPPSAVSPDKTTTYSQIDGAGRPKVVKEEITAPQAAGMVKTIIDTTNSYEGDRLVGSKRDIRTQIGSASPSSPTKQADCFVYDVFGSQTQTSRQSNYSGDPTPCGGSDASDPQPGTLETRNVFDTFERHTAGRQRNAESGDLNGTQAFCYDPLDRRDRRVAGLTGADDPAAASDEGEGRTRAQAACTKDADDLPTGAVAFDYSYVGLTEQLSRETRSGREQKYDYTASGERLGRLKGSGSTKEWRAYDTDAQGTVVGLEKPTNGQTTPDVDPETGKEKLNTYETDPFGAPVGKESDISDEASANPFRFQGFYNDPETGTYDMQARTYQPSTGRFLQQDRFEDPEADLLLASDPLTSSRYAFTAGNPGTRSEYDGHAGPPAGEGCSPTPSGVRCPPTPGSQTTTKKEVPNCGSNGCKVEPGPGGSGRAVRDNATGRTTTVTTVANGKGRAASVGSTNAARAAQAVAASSGGSPFAYRLDDSGDVAYVCNGPVGSQCFQAESGGEPVADGGREALHATLDAVGVVDPFGFADAANALAYAAEGRFKDAAISGLGLVPYAGDTAKAGRYARRLCSFGSATLVSMGDGSLRPISEVAVGDIVVTTDPKSGKRHKRRVSHAWTHADRVYLLDVAGEQLVATEDHPFWDASRRRWVVAGDLAPADRLLGVDGRRVMTRGMGPYVGVRQAYNLTVEGEHTYHVGLGRVLVHNSCPVGGAGPVRAGQRGEAAVKSRYDIGPKTSFEVNGRRRIADGMNNDALSEVKNVAYQHYSRQLRDSAQVARQRGLDFDLYVRSDTRLSSRLKQEIAGGHINQHTIPGH